MNRREFLKSAAVATLIMGAGPEAWTKLAQANESRKEIVSRSRVVVAHHPEVTDSEGRIDRNTLSSLLEQAVKGYTEKDDLRDAWASLLQPFSPSDIFGIRVNCIAAKCPTRPEVVEAIVEGLSLIGIPKEQIIVWDRTGWEMAKAGYTLNQGDKGVQYYGLDAEGIGFDEGATVEIPSAGLILPLGRLLSTICDHIINVPVIKDHSTSGSTFALKSAYAYLPLYKAIPRNDQWVKAMHSHRCDPQIAELNLCPTIRKKNRVVIGDALLGVYDKGPIAPANWRSNRLIIGKDMVATDAVALDILDGKRAEQDLPSVREKASHIHTAASYGLGQDDPAQIDRIKLNLG